MSAVRLRLDEPAKIRRRPSRAEFLPISRPSMGPEEIAAAAQVLESGWITTGPRVEEFEAELARWTGARHALAVSSGTAALHLALVAAGIGYGDEVITTSLTFVATANAIRQAGATPVFADIDSATLNLDPQAVEDALTPRTRAILPVHFAGRVCEMDQLCDLARRNGLLVIEDAAHALGSSWRGRRVGAIGDLTCFSFHPNKNLTTIEGGAITTNRDDLAERVRRLRFHGIQGRDAWSRRRGSAAGIDVVEPGFKYNLSDVAAAVGLCQFRRLEQFLDRRAELVALYRRELAGAPALRLPPVSAEISRHAWNMFTPLILVEALRCNRATVMAELKTRNIGSAVHYTPVHKLQAYAASGSGRPGSLAIADYAGARILTLPLFPAMTADDVHDVAAALHDILTRHRR